MITLGGLRWFTVVCDGLQWFVAHGGFMVVYGGLW